MTTALYTHPDCERHEMPRHPERPDRLRSVMARLEQSGITAELQLVLASEIKLSTLELVHPRTHIDKIYASEPTNQIIKLDPDTFMSPGSLRASRLAAGATTAATLAVLAGEISQAFCAIRPPGHHAEVAASMGFCLFNNIALAAEIALTNPSISRVAIIDFDVHHCNGTVDIFKDRPEVLVCSSFQENFYPHRYLDFSNEHIINTPLARGDSGTHFRRQVENQWLPAIENHQPDFIFISAGFDAHQDDPLGELNFVESDYHWVTKLLVELANRHANGRLVSTLEGGYDLASLASSVATHVSALID